MKRSVREPRNELAQCTPPNPPFAADCAGCSDALIHATLEVADGDALGRQHVDRAAPARKAVAVDAAEQALRERLKEVVRLEVGLVHPLAQPVERLGAVA